MCIRDRKDIYLAKIKLKSSYLFSNQTIFETLQRKIQIIGYNLDPGFDCFTKIDAISAEDILKVTKKYLRKPFLSIYGEEKICNKINKLWIKNF